VDPQLERDWFQTLALEDQSWFQNVPFKCNLRRYTGALDLVQCLSSLPDTEQGKTTISPQGIWKAASHSSEIRMHPGGEFFVVGNRGHDSIAVYSVDQESGAIALREITPRWGCLQVGCTS
jgi:6-phosphogluconolactonase (cycloisomerase 2 family)